MRLCPRSVHPSVLQQILAKDSHSHEDDIANGLWMTLARQICTCWTKIERRQSLINSNRTNPNNAALILPALLCRNCSSLFKDLSDPKKTSFLIHPLEAFCICAWINCSWISPAQRFPSRPIVPVVTGVTLKFVSVMALFVQIPWVSLKRIWYKYHSYFDMHCRHQTVEFT